MTGLLTPEDAADMVGALRDVATAAHAVAERFGGMGPGRWSYAGKPITDDAADPLLDLHESLNELVRVNMELAAVEANRRIETCHERVACPKCAAPVGERCVRVGSTAWGAKPLKHPHRERWTLEVPAR